MLTADSYKMNILKTNIDGVLLIEPKVFGDERGYFFESYSQREFEKKVCKVLFVQDNESKSRYGVVRGLHYQRAPYEQSKLVRVVSGRVLDVAVDIRPDSPTYGEHVATVLSDENKRQLFIPRGFAHGFAVLSDVALFQYKCDNYYAPGYEAAIRWDDPKLAIDWMLPLKDIILSEKDKNSPLL